MLMLPTLAPPGFQWRRIEASMQWECGYWSETPYGLRWLALLTLTDEMLARTDAYNGMYVVVAQMRLWFPMWADEMAGLVTW